jgi:predicted metal-dependent peptidase
MPNNAGVTAWVADPRASAGPAAAWTPAPGDHRGTRAIQRLVEFAPSTGGLALWVHHRDLDAAADQDAEGGGGAEQDTPVWTDGQTLHYRPGFSALPLAEQAGWVAHQVLHIALRHPQRYLQLQQRLGDVDLRLFNTCADAIVNSALSHLGWLSLPEDAVRLPALLAATLALEQDTETALAQWDVERLYRTMDDRQPPARTAPNSRRDGPRAARTRAFGGRGQQDLRPQPGAKSAPEVEAEQARDWRERLQRAHAGDGAHSLLRGLLADLPRTHTPWEQILRTQVARALAQQPAVSWSRPSRSYLANQGRIRSGCPGVPGQPRHGAAVRRMPWEPGQSSTRPVPRLVLVVDVSGSIDDALMQRFAREIEALSRRLAASLVLVIGDDHVQQVLHYRPGRTPLADLLKLLRFDGGGTDFTPLLAEAVEHRPDLVVVLTDLDGPARLRPACPVLWAVPETHAAAVAPFGRKLVLA